MEPIVYLAPDQPESFLIRWLLVEKEAPVKAKYVPLQGINFAEPPFYHDGDVLIHEFYALIEFLQERYPGEQLMPSDPVTRGQMRQACYYIWEAASLPELNSILESSPYLTGRHFTIVDLFAGTLIKFADLRGREFKGIREFIERVRHRPGYDERVLTQ